MSGQEGTISVKPATITSSFELRPVAQIWTSRAHSWLQLPSDLLSYPENPPSFDPIFAACSAQRAELQQRLSNRTERD